MKTKALSLSGIALGNLRNRKRQYVLLALGIVLAIYFAATALLFGFGIYTSLDERRMTRYGEQDVILFDCGGAPLDELVAEGTLSKVGKVEVLAEAIVNDSVDSSFSIAKYDDTAAALSRRRLKEGNYPIHAGEIAVEQSVLARLRTNAGVGDTVTLTLSIPDGSGFMNNTVEKTYTLTGILYDQLIYWSDFRIIDPVYCDFPAGMVSDEEQIEPGGRAAIMAYGDYAGDVSAQKVDTFCTKHGITSKLAAITMLEADDNAGQTMVFSGGFAVLIGLILVVACCLGIINAFSANLDARRRQIGLLRAVGATQKQIKQIFGREALILSLIAIPVGLALAVLSVSSIFSWLGEEYLLKLNPWVLTGVAVLGVLCVMLASRIPLRRASVIPPMQAIRDVDLIRRVQQETIRSRMEFAAPRLIASRSARIYRIKRAGISAAMAIGILVFTFTALFLVTVVRQIISSYSNDSADYQIYNFGSYSDTISYGFHEPGLTEQDKQDITALPLVKTVLGEKHVGVKLLPEKITPYATSDGWQDRFKYLCPDSGPYKFRSNEEYEQYQKVKSRFGYDSDYLSVGALALEESVTAQLEPCVYEGSINMDKLRSGEEVLIVAPKKYELYYMEDEDGGSGMYETQGEGMGVTPEEGYELVASQINNMFHAGDVITVSLLYTDAQEEYDDDGPIIPEDAVRIDKTVKIGALLEQNASESGNFSEFLDIVTTLPGIANLGFDVPYNFLSIRLSETPDAQTEAYLDDSLEKITARVPGASLSSKLEDAAQRRRMSAQMVILCAALSILMFAIVASMLNNALSAHIRAGRRSIGTLRAVGMDGRNIFRSYFYQLFPMFAWGGIIGFILSLLAGYWYSQSPSLAPETLPLPVWQPLVFVALLLGVCAWNIHVKLRGILRESITENIREL